MIFRAIADILKSKTLPGYIEVINKTDVDALLRNDPLCINDKTYDGKDYEPATIEALCNKNSIHKKLFEKYELDKIACGKTDFERTTQLLKWLTDNTFYCGMKTKKLTDNSIDILDYSFGKSFRRAINCREKAIVFADCLVAAGIKAYPVCLVAKKRVGSHLICHVYLNELQKWCAFDPSFGCYFTDESGNLLDIFEIRDLFIGGKEPTVCGYNFNGTTECFNVYMNGFLKYCCSNLSTWSDNSENRRNGKNFSGKKIFNTKLP